MKEKTIKIARSFSRKLNKGNYETEDFWALAEREVPLEEKDKVSLELEEFVRLEVDRDVEARRVELWKEKNAGKKSQDVGLDSAEHEAAESPQSAEEVSIFS